MKWQKGYKIFFLKNTFNICNQNQKRVVLVVANVLIHFFKLLKTYSYA